MTDPVIELGIQEKQCRFVDYITQAFEEVDFIEPARTGLRVEGNASFGSFMAVHRFISKSTFEGRINKMVEIEKVFAEMFVIAEENRIE